MFGVLLGDSCIVCVVFFFHSSKFRKHYQLQKFVGKDIKYRGRNVLPTVNPTLAKLQRQRLQQPTALQNGYTYYPLNITKPHIEVVTKITRVNDTLVPKTFIATLRTAIVTDESSYWFGKSRSEVTSAVHDILQEAQISHQLKTHFARMTDNKHKMSKDKYEQTKTLGVNWRGIVEILCENEKNAVMAQVTLHQVKAERKWSITLSQNIKRAVYVKVPVIGILAYLFCGVEESEAIEDVLNKVLAIIHCDAIGHHPKTTMVTLKFASYDGRKIFRGKNKVSEVLPAIIAVGSDTQSRQYLREVLMELANIIMRGYLNVSGGYQRQKTFTYCISERVVVILDRFVVPMVSGGTQSRDSAGIIYSVCNIFSCCFLISLL